MTTIDVNEYRDSSINLHELKNMNKKYTFYYDETNNERKFHLQKGKFNIKIDQNFVLGGLAYEGEKKEFQIKELFKELNLQKNIAEVKFKYIASGNFVDLLKSKKINLILRWIDSNYLYLHYTNLNPLYFGIVDIIDSAVVSSETINAFNLMYLNDVKNQLYIALNDNIEYTEAMFFKYDYPNVNKDNIEKFIETILDILEPYRDIPERHLGIETAIQILKASKRKQSLPFIQDQTKHVLMQDYSSLYIKPLCMFKNSKHYFDKEDQIQKALNQYKYVDKNRKLDHYEFVDSKDHDLIQLSDVMMGLLGKLYACVRQNSISDLQKTLYQLDDLQRENLNIINKLTWKSQRECSAFLTQIVSHEEREREYILLP